MGKRSVLTALALVMLLFLAIDSGSFAALFFVLLAGSVWIITRAIWRNLDEPKSPRAGRRRAIPKEVLQKVWRGR